MSEQSEITNDDKLLAALGYPIAIVPIIVMVMEDKKNRAFLRYHAIQSIIFNIALWAALIVFGTFTLGLGFFFAPLLWLVTLWPAFDSYNGKYTEIPVITKFAKNQGWL
jgi:uncharacterized membrane protein